MPHQTTRERVAQHKEDPACAGCHELLDPIGLGLEHYDEMGRFRSEEGGRPIDASGALLNADFASEAFVGASELAQKLATSDVVRSCAVKQWFRYAYGRAETEADASSVEALTQTFKASGDNFPELLLALTQTPVFLYRGCRHKSRTQDRRDQRPETYGVP